MVRSVVTALHVQRMYLTLLEQVRLQRTYQRLNDGLNPRKRLRQSCRKMRVLGVKIWRSADAARNTKKLMVVRWGCLSKMVKPHDWYSHTILGLVRLLSIR